MCFYLVYPPIPLIGVVGAVSLMISLPGASGPKVQMVAPCGVVRATVPVTPEGFSVLPRVPLKSQRLFMSAPREVAGSASFCRGP